MSKGNLILAKRTAAGLSQRALAELVGTSQQQIQRVESGVQTVRIDLAARIADALNASLTEIFPALGEGGTAKRKKRRVNRNVKPPPFSNEQLSDAGIEADPRHWTVSFGFDDGREFNYYISSGEKERISSIIWSKTFDFFVFDTNTKRVAVNRAKINYAHFLFDIGVIQEHEVQETEQVVINFIGNKEAVKFDVEPDTVDLGKDDAGFNSQIQNMFFYIEGNEADEDEILWFDDVDGERVYVRSKQVLSIEVPLLCCEPELWRNYLENLDDTDTEEETTRSENEGNGQ